MTVIPHRFIQEALASRALAVRQEPYAGFHSFWGLILTRKFSRREMSWLGSLAFFATWFTSKATGTVHFKRGLGEVLATPITEWHAFSQAKIDANPEGKAFTDAVLRFYFNRQIITAQARNFETAGQAVADFQKLKDAWLRALPTYPQTWRELHEILSGLKITLSDEPAMRWNQVMYLALPRYLARRGIFLQANIGILNPFTPMIPSPAIVEAQEQFGLRKVLSEPASINVFDWDGPARALEITVGEFFAFNRTPIGDPNDPSVAKSIYNTIMRSPRNETSDIDFYTAITNQNTPAEDFTGKSWSPDLTVNNFSPAPLIFSKLQWLLKLKKTQNLRQQVSVWMLSSSRGHEYAHLKAMRQGRIDLGPAATTLEDYDRLQRGWNIANEIDGALVELRLARGDLRGLYMISLIDDIYTNDQIHWLRQTISYNVVDLLLEELITAKAPYTSIVFQDLAHATRREQAAAQLYQLTDTEWDRALGAMRNAHEARRERVKRLGPTALQDLYQRPLTPAGLQAPKHYFVMAAAGVIKKAAKPFIPTSVRLHFSREELTLAGIKDPALFPLLTGEKETTPEAWQLLLATLLNQQPPEAERRHLTAQEHALIFLTLKVANQQIADRTIAKAIAMSANAIAQLKRRDLMLTKTRDAIVDGIRKIINSQWTEPASIHDREGFRRQRESSGNSLFLKSQTIQNAPVFLGMKRAKEATIRWIRENKIQIEREYGDHRSFILILYALAVSGKADFHWTSYAGTADYASKKEDLIVGKLDETWRRLTSEADPRVIRAIATKPANITRYITDRRFLTHLNHSAIPLSAATARLVLSSAMSFYGNALVKNWTERWVLSHPGRNSRTDVLEVFIFALQNDIPIDTWKQIMSYSASNEPLKRKVYKAAMAVAKRWSRWNKDQKNSRPAFTSWRDVKEKALEQMAA